MKHFQLSLFFFMLLCSCAAPRFTNNDRGRYEHEDLDAGTSAKVVQVKAGILPQVKPQEPPKEMPPTFINLKDTLNFAYLRAVASKARNVDQLLLGLRAELINPRTVVENTPTGSTNEVDLTEVKVRLLISNIKKYYYHKDLLHPNTRLEFLDTEIKLDDTNFVIYSVDRIQNDFEIIDMGTLSREQTAGFTTNITPEIGSSTETISDKGGKTTSITGNEEVSESDVYNDKGIKIGTIKTTQKPSTEDKTNNTKTTSKSGASAKADLKYSNEETIKEALSIKFKKMKTGFAFTNNSITLMQRGYQLSDISDNVVINLTLKLKNIPTGLTNTKTVSTFNGLFAALGNPIEPNKINPPSNKLVSYFSCQANPNLNIPLEIKYEGLIRATRNLTRGRNILESDDKVKYYTIPQITSPAQNVNVPLSSQCTEVFRLKVKTLSNTEYILHSRAGALKEVYFYLKDNPAIFQDWLMAQLAIANLAGTPLSHFTNPNLNLVFRAVLAGSQPDEAILMGPNFLSADLDFLKTIRSVGFEIVK